MEEQPTPPKPKRPTFSDQAKLLVGLCLLVAIGLTVYVVEQQQNVQQEASHRRRTAAVPTTTVTPSPALPTLAPISEDDAYAVVSKTQVEVEDYLDQYHEDILEAQRVNGAFDLQAL